MKKLSLIVVAFLLAIGNMACEGEKEVGQPAVDLTGCYEELGTSQAEIDSLLGIVHDIRFRKAVKSAQFHLTRLKSMSSKEMINLDDKIEESMSLRILGIPKATPEDYRKWIIGELGKFDLKPNHIGTSKDDLDLLVKQAHMKSAAQNLLWLKQSAAHDTLSMGEYPEDYAKKVQEELKLASCALTSNI